MSGVTASSRDRTVESHHTKSPGRNRVASGPVDTTRPMAPTPEMTGGSRGYLRSPLKTSSAYGGTHVATTSTNTSPVPASGSGTSLIVNGFPNCSSTAAFIVVSFHLPPNGDGRVVDAMSDATTRHGWYDVDAWSHR